MRWFFLGVILTVLFVALPYNAFAQEAILAFVCTDKDQAEVLAGEITDHSPPLTDAKWSSCQPIGKPVGSMSGAPPPYLGPLTDWEGDTFALYTDGEVVFVMFWVNGYVLDESEI